MYLVIRRKIAVPRDPSTPFVVEVKGAERDPQTPFESLLQALSFDARKDGQETGGVLLEVTDHD